MTDIYINQNEKNDTNEANLERVFGDSNLERSITEEIDAMIKENPGQPFTVIQMDMDKSVEIRKCGISVKIMVLEEISRMLAMFEGDDCVVIPHGTRDDVTIIRKSRGDIDDDKKFVAKILKMIETTPICISYENRIFNITYSAGISVYPANGKNSIQLLELADGAVRFVKDNGRNAYAIADTGYRFTQCGKLDDVRWNKLFAISCKTGISIDELIREGYEALFQKHAAFYRFCCQEREIDL